MNKPPLSDEVRLVLQFGKQNIPDLVRWLDENRNQHEILDVEHSHDTLWYIKIIDTRVPEYQTNCLIGFTVNSKGDSIFWNSDRITDQFGEFGGHCFCRSERWWRKAKKQFNINKEMMRDFRRSPPRFKLY